MQNSIKFWDNYYNKGKHAESPFTKELHALILSLISVDVRSILDAGCGGGALMAKLASKNKWEVSGIDLSHTGVKYINEYLKLNAQQGSIINMPFSDNSFDLIICSEVIEHLTNEESLLAINELVRVSKKYVMITTPYKENLGYHQVKCMNCKSTFHGAGHIQSIDEQFLRERIGRHTKDIKFYFSGKREFRSTLYADFCRSMNNNMLFIEGLRCPFCSAEIEKNKLSPIAKIISYVHRAVQILLKKTGICIMPNNIICVAEK